MPNWKNCKLEGLETAASAALIERTNVRLLAIKAPAAGIVWGKLKKMDTNWTTRLAASGHRPEQVLKSFGEWRYQRVNYAGLAIGQKCLHRLPLCFK